MERSFGTGTSLLRGLVNHGYQSLTSWDDPPSMHVFVYIYFSPYAYNDKKEAQQHVCG